MKPVPVLLLLCLAPLAVPAAAADLEDAIAMPDVVDLNLPDDLPVSTFLDDLLRGLLRGVRPGGGPGVDAEYVTPTFSFECTVLSTGARQCTGLVCTTDSGEGPSRVSPGRIDEGIVGVGVGEDEDGDGWYGPYSGVYVSLGGNCGCTTGVGIRWVVG